MTGFFRPVSRFGINLFLPLLHLPLWLFLARKYDVNPIDQLKIKSVTGLKFLYFMTFFLLRKKLKKDELIFLCKMSARLESHSLFEALCRNYTQDKLHFHYEPKKFYGEGHGEGALKTYRMVENDCQTHLFEKIVFSHSEDKSNIDHFFYVIQKELEKTRILFPRLLECHEGGLLTAYYYEYLADTSQQDLFSRQDPRIDELIIFYLDELFRVGTQQKALLTLKADTLHQQVIREGLAFIKHAEFTRLSRAERYELYHSFLKGICCSNDNLVFSHGDLSADNFNRSGFLWDWDRAGLYPVGYDLAWAVIANARKEEGIEAIYNKALRIGTLVYGEKYSSATLKRNIFAFVVICFFRKHKVSSRTPKPLEDFIMYYFALYK